MKLIRAADLQWSDVPGLEGKQARVADATTADDSTGFATGFVTMEDVTITRRLAYDEIVHIVSGRMEVELDGRTAVAGPGDCVFLPKGSTPTCAWREPTRFFFAISPANWRELIETPVATA
jgi:ethanolamine utilization protein EutQ (cupin superfamily)